MSTKNRTPLLLGTCLLVAALLFSALPGHSVNAQSTVLTFRPTADSYVNSNQPATNYGTITLIKVDSTNPKLSYLRFVVNGLNGAAIQSAKLRLYATSPNPVGYTVSTESNNTWTETGITYSNAPAPGTAIATSPAIVAGQWIEANVSSYIKGEGTYNLVLSINSPDLTELASRESGANAPQLVVTLGTAAPTATGVVAQTPVSKPLPTATTAPATGAVYYVSTAGNDNNSGTASSPFRTVAKGISVLPAGGTLYLRSGTYVQSKGLIISKSGTSSSRITIATAPGEPTRAIISGDTNGDGVGDVPAAGASGSLIEIRGSYVTLANLELAYTGGKGISSYGSQAIISGNIVHNTWRSGIKILAANNVVQNNTTYRTTDSNYCNLAVGRKCNGDWGGGIAWGNSSDSVAPGVASGIVVRNNRVYHTSGEGLICMHTDNGLVEGNVLYDNWAVNIYLDQCSNVTIQNNLAYNTGDKAWWRSSTYPAAGIEISNEAIPDSTGKTYPLGRNRKVINNILVGNSSNFFFWKGRMTGSAMINDLVADNTLVNTQGTGAGMQIDSGPHSNSRVQNNLVLQASGTLANVPSTSGLSFAHNLWSRTPSSSVVSSTDVIADPLLVDPSHTRSAGSVLADWYRLSSSSPAISKAQTLSEVTTDYWKISRDSNPDIGANEYKP